MISDYWDEHVYIKDYNRLIPIRIHMFTIDNFNLYDYNVNSYMIL